MDAAIPVSLVNVKLPWVTNSLSVNPNHFLVLKIDDQNLGWGEIAASQLTLPDDTSLWGLNLRQHNVMWQRI